MHSRLSNFKSCPARYSFLTLGRSSSPSLSKMLWSRVHIPGFCRYRGKRWSNFQLMSFFVLSYLLHQKTRGHDLQPFLFPCALYNVHIRNPVNRSIDYCGLVIFRVTFSEPCFQLLITNNLSRSVFFGPAVYNRQGRMVVRHQYACPSLVFHRAHVEGYWWR